MNYYSPRVHINHPRVNQPQAWHQEAEEALRARLSEAEDKVKKLQSRVKVLEEVCTRLKNKYYEGKVTSV